MCDNVYEVTGRTGGGGSDPSQGLFKIKHSEESQTVELATFFLPPEGREAARRGLSDRFTLLI